MYTFSLHEQRACLQVDTSGYGSCVKLINADSNTALRSCGVEEVVRDTVLEDNSPAARWILKPCEGGCWFACRPTSDDSEVRLMHRSVVHRA